MKLDDLIVYRLAMDISDEIWLHVEKWDAFAKWTTGKQLVESADSMAANISEGYGRYYFKENRQFQYFSRGSQSETITWLTKARNRGLIKEEEFVNLMKKIEELGKRHNSYINSIGRSSPFTNDQWPVTSDQ